MKTLEYLDVAHNNDLGGAVPHTFAGLELETFYSTKTELCTPPSLKAWFDGISRTDNPTICTGRVMLYPSSLHFEAIGDTATLSATAMTAEGDTLHDVVVTWTSADTDIATVDSTGLVTSVDYGTTEITASSDSLTGRANVEIVFTLSDREVLEILYGATGGENWTDTTNWLSDEPLSEWFGVAANEAGKVVGLSLANNNLIGSIPEELGELDDLAILDLGHNSLTGPLSGHLGALRQLRDLLLNGNALEGLLPPDLGSVTGLRYLHIGDNKLSGVVPGSFANLELDTLYAAGSGVCVPPSLGGWFDGIEQTDDTGRCVASIAIEVADQQAPIFYAIGESATLSASYVNAEGDTLSTVPAMWSSGDTAVVSVDEAGTVTAVGDGETRVTATYDSISASIDVLVDLPESDRDVLAILFDRARGEGWTDATNWLSEEPLSEWAGVQTDDSGAGCEPVAGGEQPEGADPYVHRQAGPAGHPRPEPELDIRSHSGRVRRPEASFATSALSVNGFSGRPPLRSSGTLDSLRNAQGGRSRACPAGSPRPTTDLDLDTLLTNGYRGCVVPPSLAPTGWNRSQGDRQPARVHRPCPSIEPSHR